MTLKIIVLYIRIGIVSGRENPTPTLFMYLIIDKTLFTAQLNYRIA